MWESPSFRCSWEQIAKRLSGALALETDCRPERILQNDSRQNLNHTQRQLWLSACTAATETSHSFYSSLNHSLIEILSIKLSVAGMSGTGQVMLQAWKQALNTARARIYIFIFGMAVL